MRLDFGFEDGRGFLFVHSTTGYVANDLDESSHCRKKKANSCRSKPGARQTTTRTRTRIEWHTTLLFIGHDC